MNDVPKKLVVVSVILRILPPNRPSYNEILRQCKLKIFMQLNNHIWLLERRSGLARSVAT